MTAEPGWEELWDRLNDFYAVLVGELVACNERLWSQISHQETPAFPFTGYVSLGRGGTPGDEDLVLEWAVQRCDDRLRVTADIARGDGTVLAELPAEEFAEPVDHSSVAEAQERGFQFFRRHLELMKREVCRSVGSVPVPCAVREDDCAARAVLGHVRHVRGLVLGAQGWTRLRGPRA
jgi:hypothetical protein